VKRLAVPLLLIVAVLAIAVASWWLKQPATATTIACADALAGCRFEHRGAPASVRFSVPPVPLEPFEIRLTGTTVERASAEFQMVGMDMGFNRYDLRRAADGALVARVTLPVCVSGRRDWVLYLDLDGRRYALGFSTP
jgi:hypothetical protein